MPRPDLSATDAADTNAAYDQFLARKLLTVPAVGREVSDADIHPMLFPFQRDLVRWAVKKGRAAIWADTGLGKTLMQVEFARLSRERALIIAPLAVCQQTIREAAKVGVEAVYARRASDCGPVTVTNYEMVEKVNPQSFGCVVLDESGILKNFAGVMRQRLTEMFAETPWRLCCTATPCPNETVELTNHSDFLGILKGREVLSMFFKHVNKNEYGSNDTTGSGWRLKRHAVESFYRWLASWAMSVKRPSDLGYEDDGFILPPLKIEPVIVDCDVTPKDRLFFDGLKGIQDRVATRRATLAARVQSAVDLVGSDDQPWVCWTGLNEEANELARLIPGSVNVEGCQSPETKAERLLGFADGKFRVLICKPGIAAHGLNLQHCARMAFVGLSDSMEQYYQAIRRCYRFGQTREVIVYVILSEPERAIFDNVLRKEREWNDISGGLVKAVAGYEREELRGVRRRDVYQAKKRVEVPAWL